MDLHYELDLHQPRINNDLNELAERFSSDRKGQLREYVITRICELETIQSRYKNIEDNLDNPVDKSILNDPQGFYETFTLVISILYSIQQIKDTRTQVIIDVETFWDENQMKQLRKFKMGNVYYAFRAKPTVYNRSQKPKLELLELELARLAPSKMKGLRFDHT